MEKGLCYNCKWWRSHDREWSKENEYSELCKTIEDYVEHDCNDGWNAFETKWDFGCRFWEEHRI